MARASRTKGFTLIELLIVVVIILIMAAVAIPLLGPTLQNYRLTGDARNISSSLALARMRAASKFNRAEVCFDFTGGNCTTNPPSPPNSYMIELYIKGTSPARYAPEAGTQPQSLSQGVTFGFGTLTTGPGGLTTVAQPPGNIVGTAQIVFNSRGITVDNAGNAVGSETIYISNGQRYCAVTASLAGQTAAWRYVSNAWSQM